MPCDEQHQLMKTFEVVVVVREQDSTCSDCMHKVSHVKFARQSDLGWELDIMGVRLKETHEQCVGRIDIQI